MDQLLPKFKAAYLKEYAKRSSEDSQKIPA